MSKPITADDIKEYYAELEADLRRDRRPYSAINQMMVEQMRKLKKYQESEMIKKMYEILKPLLKLQRAENRDGYTFELRFFIPRDKLIDKQTTRRHLARLQREMIQIFSNCHKQIEKFDR